MKYKTNCMGNWPNYIKWRKQERNRKNSERFLSFIEKLPDLNISRLKYFKSVAQHRHEQRDHGAVKCPKGITVSPAFLTFYDLYFTEDFLALERGLINLLESGVKIEPYWRSPKDQIPELFQTWKTSPGRSSWNHIAYMTFERSSLNPDTFKALSIDLYQISPTCISLVISAFPNDGFKDRFRKIISEEVQNTYIAKPLSIFTSQWRTDGILASQVRQNELEELFLDLNREVVLLLRDYIGCGWAATGPLPSIHCFSCNYESDVDPKDKLFSEFWRSLSLTRCPSMYYTNESGVDVLHPDWFENGTFTNPYRILVDSAAYLTESLTQHYANAEMALFYNLEDALIRQLAPLFALREQSLRLVKSISEYRDRLSPAITIKKNPLIRLLSKIKLILIPPRIYSLSFSLNRITESTIQRFLEQSGTTVFHRKTRKDKEVLIEADIRDETNHLTNYVSEQLKILRDAYHDLWNYCIQWILIVIAFIGLLIAAIQFFDKEKEAIPSPGSTFIEQFNLSDEDVLG